MYSHSMTQNIFLYGKFTIILYRDIIQYLYPWTYTFYLYVISVYLFIFPKTFQHSPYVFSVCCTRTYDDPRIYLINHKRIFVFLFSPLEKLLQTQNV